MSQQVPTVTPAEVVAAQAAKGPVTLLDVREADEYVQVRAPFGAHHALSALQRGTLPSTPKDQRIYVVCKMGGRGEAAARILLGAGFLDVLNVAGGMTAWEKSGLPVSRGP